MHRAPYPTEPSFGWIPTQDVAPQRFTPTPDSSEPPAASDDHPVWIDTADVSETISYESYWTPFSSEFPPTIVRKRPRAPLIQLGVRAKYPVMVALTVAAVSSSGVLPAVSSSAQAAPSDSEITGSFSAVDPSVDNLDVVPNVVPESATGVGGGSGSYLVQPGDTLREIASSLGIDTMALVDANGIANPDLIFPGQELVIPGADYQAESVVTVIVERGDTVSKIAARHGVSARAIIDYAGNNLTNPDLIFPGQELTIPGGVASDSGNQAVQLQSDTVAEVASAETVSNPEPAQTSAPQSAAGQQIVDLAMNYVGYPYVWGAVGPNSFDCSGFTYFILNQVVGGVARDMESQARSGIAVSPEELQPGDIVFQQNTYKAGMSHVGIYIGDGKFINAANPSVGVVISDLWDSYWGPRFHSARRIG